jgi:hypothetical protein
MIGHVDFIETRSPQIVAEYRQKLEAKVAELLKDTQIEEGRLATEVVLFADKICVDEETVRLRSHMEHTKATLNEEDSVGRKLDFIAQEMNREANTILSKANDLEISNHAIELKTSIEKVREQIQNGTYTFTDEVDVHSMPRTWRFMPLGKATLTHTVEDGFVLTGHYRGQDYRIQRQPLEINSLHVEYDFPHIKPFDCVDISTENDSFYCFPTKQNVVTKLAFATEEVYQLHQSKTKRKVNL